MANLVGGVLTPKEVAELLSVHALALAGLPARDKEIIALHAIYVPNPRIVKMLGVDKETVSSVVVNFGHVVKDVPDSIRMKILRMTIWRFAAAAVSALMDPSSLDNLDADSALKSLDKIPGIMERLAQVEKTLIDTEKQHKEMNFSEFGKSLGK
jgi:hypothetical protein